MGRKTRQDKTIAADLSRTAHASRAEGRVARRTEEKTTLQMENPEKRLAATAPDALGELLVRRGLITRHQLFNALNESYRTGSSLADAILALGMLAREKMEEAVRDEGQS